MPSDELKNVEDVIEAWKLMTIAPAVPVAMTTTALGEMIETVIDTMIEDEMAAHTKEDASKSQDAKIATNATMPETPETEKPNDILVTQEMKDMTHQVIVTPQPDGAIGVMIMASRLRRILPPPHTPPIPILQLLEVQNLRVAQTEA